MAYNPVTGEFDYGGESYDAPTAGVGMAMAGMGAVGADVPLAFRMMENIPGITAMAGHNARRFSNTMFRGGFLDIQAGASARKVARARKFGAAVGGVAQKPTAEGFLFGKRRFGGGVPSGKTPLFKASRVTNFTARPRIFGRMGSVTQLGGVANAGFYTPFQGGSFLESMFGNRVRAQAVKSGAVRPGSTETMFSGGVLGRMTTMSNVYSLEQRQARLLEKATNPRTSARKTERLTKRINKIDSRLTGLDKNIMLLQDMATPDAGRTVASVMNRTGSTRVGMTGMTAQERLAMARTGAITPEMEAVRAARMSGIQSNRLRAVSDSSKGMISRSITEYMGTMLSPDKFLGTRAYGALHQNISKTLLSQVKGQQFNMAGTSAKVTDFLAGGTIDDFGKFGVKSLSKLSKVAFSGGERMAAAKLAGAAGTRALGLALPGLNVIATASMVYDLTKLAAMGVVSAGNFAKDAVKSMQGSMHKPLFGMGYQDTEVAATSRARGVMAIQNSRLNARSTLGSEASMMAAHFG